jgi:predicted  nucleic acid-binding Zn-ribbon protein
MPETLVEVLARYHRDTLRPDFERMLFAQDERQRGEVQGLFDGLTQRMDRLDTELHMMVAGLERVEERLDKVEARLDNIGNQLGSIEEALQRTALRSELDRLKSRVSALQRQIQEIEARL